MAGGLKLKLRSIAALSFLCFLSFWPSLSIGIGHGSPDGHSLRSRFSEAPNYRNRGKCHHLARSENDLILGCDPKLVHVAIPLDLEYLRGSLAAVNSILFHASCPENIFFHFIAAELAAVSPRELSRLICSTFPFLNFKIYIFRPHFIISNLISSAGHPLKYARNFLGEIMEPCLNRVIYLDSDVILNDDIHKLWKTRLSDSRVIGARAMDYCYANYTNYLSGSGELEDSRRPCHFNTGVMVMDLRGWREGNYKDRIEIWIDLQRIFYNLDSFPSLLLELGAIDLEAIDHRWNEHGLGGDKVSVWGSCRALHPGPVSLLHWSGEGKPWVRLGLKRPCPLDYWWETFDLYKHDDDDDDDDDDESLPLPIQE